MSFTNFVCNDDECTRGVHLIVESTVRAVNPIHISFTSTLLDGKNTYQASKSIL